MDFWLRAIFWRGIYGDFFFFFLRNRMCNSLSPREQTANSYRGLRPAESSASVKGGEASFRVSMETVFLSPLTFCFSFLSFLFLPFSHSLSTFIRSGSNESSFSQTNFLNHLSIFQIYACRADFGRNS